MNRVVIVASHRRSGTHLTLDSLRMNALDLDPDFLTLEAIEPGHPEHIPAGEFERRLTSGTGTVLVKTHAPPGRAAWASEEAADYAEHVLRRWPAIYVHRDGRDTLVSLHHFVATYSPEVATLSFGDFIREQNTSRGAAGISRAAFWQRHVLEWLELQPAANVRFERLRSDFGGAMTDLARQLELRLRPSISPVRISDPVPGWRRRLRRGLRAMTGRAARSTAIRPRSGGSGGWRASFNDADLAWFEAEAGEAMARLGYD